MSNHFYRNLLALFSLLLLTFTANHHLKAQETRFILKTNPLGLAFGSFNAAYEQALTDKASFVVGGNVYFGKIFDVKTTGFGAFGEYRYYITNEKKDVPEGFYVGPTGTFGFVNIESEDEILGVPVESESYSGGTIGIGGVIGYQWIFDSQVVLDVGIGPQYTFALFDAGDLDYSGFLPRLTLALGYAFQ